MLLALGNGLHTCVVDRRGSSSLDGTRIVSVAGNANVPVLLQVQLDVSGFQYTALPMLGEATSKFCYIFNKLVDMLLQKLSK